MSPPPPSHSRYPLLALAGILVATGLWWALALWPLPGETPSWLTRTREICFGATRTGLPTPAGWMVLVMEPATLILALVVVWGEELRAGLRGLSGALPGRMVLGTGATTILVGALLAGARIVSASAAGEESFDPAAASWRRLAVPPALSLTDQHGRRFTLAGLGGRSAVVTFAYGHCATVCPTVVHDLLAARGRQADPVLVVVTLDPRRDPPARLSAIAAQWGLAAGDVVLSGSVAEVERTAVAWGIVWRRDSLTGEIVHSTPLFALAGAGGGAFQVSAAGGGAARAVVLARGGGR